VCPILGERGVQTPEAKPGKQTHKFPIGSFAKANKFDIFHLKAQFPPVGKAADMSSQVLRTWAGAAKSLQ
jgi:hypothetical protein